MADPDPGSAHTSADERDRAEDFLNAFNAIEAELKRRTGIEPHRSFSSAARAFVQRNRWWRRDFEALEAFSDLRNVIVHTRTERFAYLSIPSPEVVAEIRVIRDRLLHPRTVFDEFRHRGTPGGVETVQLADTLASLLARVARTDHTRFPAYEGERFRGVVTGKGVARWFAQRAENGGFPDPREVRVRELLARESERPNWLFVPRSMPIAELAQAFAHDPRLEAALITEHGREDQGLLGIATPSDVTGLVAELF